MNAFAPKLVVFTDLDGCLLDKSNYDWSAAAPVLRRLGKLSIPVVLNSSKTSAEMSVLASDLQLEGLPFIAENGGIIRWNDLSSGGCADSERILGRPRDEILSVLRPLSKRLRFRTFDDLGINGVMDATGLTEEKAALATARQSTEPLLWDDSDENLTVFRQTLIKQNLTLTRGGRFWHVAGPTNKGRAMLEVVDQYRHLYSPVSVVSAGIGDSPIDQSMLDLADYPIGIPDGESLNVEIEQTRGFVATTSGSSGWAEAVTQLLQRFGYTNDTSL